MSWKHLKGAIVKHVEHTVTKRTGVIRLDKRHMWFFARENDLDLLTEPYAAKDGGDVEAWLLLQLKHTSADNNMEWIPVVAIEHGGDSHHYYRDSSQQEQSESIDVTLKRYFIGLTRDEREWRKLDWEECDPASSTCIPDNERYAASRKYGIGPKGDRSSFEKPFRLPHFTERGSGDKIVVAFAPELWAGLVLIVKQIKLARENIAKLVGTKEGVATLAEIGTGRTPLLLTAPKEKKS